MKMEEQIENQQLVECVECWEMYDVDTEHEAVRVGSYGHICPKCWSIEN